MTWDLPGEYPCPSWQPDHEGIPHVVADIAQEAEGDCLPGLVSVFLHGEKVGQDLGRVGFIGQPIPHGHIGIAGQSLCLSLGKAAPQAAPRYRLRAAARRTDRVPGALALAKCGAGISEICLHKLDNVNSCEGKGKTLVASPLTFIHVERVRSASPGLSDHLQIASNYLES